MAGFFRRISDIFRAKANRAVDRMERPEDLLDRSYEQQLELLGKLRQQLTAVVATKKRLQSDAERSEQGLVKLEEQARIALRAGREDLAREALERKALAKEKLQSLDRDIAEVEVEENRLATLHRALAERVAEFRTRKEVMKAQHTAAEAQATVAGAAAGIDGDFAEIGRSIQKVEAKTEELRARAAAVGELVDTGVVDDALGSGRSTDFDREIAALSAEQGVEAELARLRAEIGPPAGGEALPPGSSS